MPEEKVDLPVGGIRLEGLVDNKDGPCGVVVAHPHPLYGGNMHNNVVEALVRAYAEKGFSTLRFNFRGVEGSGGRYDNGKGEVEDLKAALEYLGGLGKTRIDLAGYSFGAWVMALGLKELAQTGRVVMVSPPCNYMDLSFLGYSPEIRLVIVGSRDEIAGPTTLEGMVLKWNPKAHFRIIQGADHFYWGKEGEITRAVSEFLSADCAD